MLGATRDLNPRHNGIRPLHCPLSHSGQAKIPLNFCYIDIHGKVSVQEFNSYQQNNALDVYMIYTVTKSYEKLILERQFRTFLRFFVNKPLGR